MAAARDTEYEMVRVTADSGASDHVAPVHVASHIRRQSTEASRGGVSYQAANGQQIYNLGQREVEGVTEAGMPIGMACQVAEVKRPLASIGRMCDAANSDFHEHWRLHSPREQGQGDVNRVGMYETGST